MVGDGGFMMTGNEMIAAVERKLPILFILANNASYASIRIQQELHYPGRVLGTSLFNPDFEQIARAFGMRAQRRPPRTGGRRGAQRLRGRRALFHRGQGEPLGHAARAAHGLRN